MNKLINLLISKHVFVGVLISFLFFACLIACNKVMAQHQAPSNPRGNLTLQCKPLPDGTWHCVETRSNRYSTKQVEGQPCGRGCSTNDGDRALRILQGEEPQASDSGFVLLDGKEKVNW